jgi:asparagine synthetase B (glutamine-hydrolysing)
VSQFALEALPELDGDLSLVLGFPHERRFVAFRDLTGARPFLYSFRGGKFRFSNTIQAILADRDLLRDRYVQQFIADFLLGSPHHDPDRTVYLDIRSIPPGHLLEFSPAGLSVRRIANFPIEDLLPCDRDEEPVEEFLRLFTQAVADRLPDAHTSIFLSGGLDSTLIAAAVVALRRKASSNARLNSSALCVDLQPLLNDTEGHYASLVANTFGIPLKLVHSGGVSSPYRLGRVGRSLA